LGAREDDAIIESDGMCVGGWWWWWGGENVEDDNDKVQKSVPPNGGNTLKLIVSSTSSFCQFASNNGDSKLFNLGHCEPSL